jgi:hypothetical protein
MNKFGLTVIVALAAGIWALALSAHGWVIPSSFFEPLSVVEAALSVGVLLFEVWLWRVPGLNTLLKHPDLRGTWKGAVRPTKGPNSSAVINKPIEVYLVVRQTYSTLHLSLFSVESQSVSLAAKVVEEADGEYFVTWTYRSEPKLSVQDRSRIHLGGALLRLGGPPANVMSGHYWTDRDSAGEIDFSLATRRRVNDYSTAQQTVKASANPEASSPAA